MNTANGSRQKAWEIMEHTFAVKGRPDTPRAPVAQPPAIAPAPFSDWQQYNRWQSGQHRVDSIHIGAGHIMSVFGL